MVFQILLWQLQDFQTITLIGKMKPKKPNKMVKVSLSNEYFIVYMTLDFIETQKLTYWILITKYIFMSLIPYFIIVEVMNQSQKLLSLQSILSESNPLKTLLQLISKTSLLYPDFGAESFTTSDHMSLLIRELSQLKIPEINEIMEELREPDAIVALPIKMETQFALFFVIVPTGHKFDWHSHPHMHGLSKCIHGQLQVSTINIHALKSGPSNFLFYPRQHLRIELINGTNNTVSNIEPNAYNIHRIQAKSLSAFFDLLMPDYPDNKCQFFRTLKESNQELCLQQLSAPLQLIKGWDTFLQDLTNSEKHFKKTYILQGGTNTNQSNF